MPPISSLAAACCADPCSGTPVPLLPPLVVLSRVLEHQVPFLQPIVVLSHVLEHLVLLLQPLVVLSRILEYLVPLLPPLVVLSRVRVLDESCLQLPL